MNSPWGVLYHLVKETGWSLHTLLWKVSRINLDMMLLDQPGSKYVKNKYAKGSGKDLAAKLRAKMEK